MVVGWIEISCRDKNISLTSMQQQSQKVEDRIQTVKESFLSFVVALGSGLCQMKTNDFQRMHVILPPTTYPDLKTKKKLAAPGVPKQSFIQVLSGPNVARLQ